MRISLKSTILVKPENTLLIVVILICVYIRNIARFIKKNNKQS